MSSKDSEPTDSKLLLCILWAGIVIAFFYFVYVYLAIYKKNKELNLYYHFSWILLIILSSLFIYALTNIAFGDDYNTRSGPKMGKGYNNLILFILGLIAFVIITNLVFYITYKRKNNNFSLVMDEIDNLYDGKFFTIPFQGYTTYNWILLVIILGIIGAIIAVMFTSKSNVMYVVLVTSIIILTLMPFIYIRVIKTQEDLDVYREQANRTQDQIKREVEEQTADLIFEARETETEAKQRAAEAQAAAQQIAQAALEDAQTQAQVQAQAVARARAEAGRAQQAEEERARAQAEAARAEAGRAEARAEAARAEARAARTQLEAARTQLEAEEEIERAAEAIRESKVREAEAQERAEREVEKAKAAAGAGYAYY